MKIFFLVCALANAVFYLKASPWICSLAIVAAYLLGLVEGLITEGRRRT